MELPPSFSENSMLTLDSSTRSSRTAVPSSPQTSQKNSVIFLDMKSPYPQRIILKPMEKWKDSIRKSRPTSTSSVVLTLKPGLTISPWPSLSTTTTLTPPLASPHSTSCSDMNHRPFLVSLKPPTSRHWKNALETLTHHEKKRLLRISLHSNS